MLSKISHNSKNGFSLVELIVAIAIIGVLAGIAVPRFVSYREKSAKARILADLTAIDMAMEYYYLRKGSYPAQEEVNANHPLVKEGYLSKVPVPPNIYISEFGKTPYQYWTENDSVGGGTEAWKGFIVNADWSDACSVGYLKENKKW